MTSSISINPTIRKRAIPMPHNKKWPETTSRFEADEIDVGPGETFTKYLLEIPLTHHGAEAILAHPHYPQARAAFVSGMIDLYADDPVLNRMLVEAGRLGIFSFVLGQWSDYSPRDRKTWPTVNRLKRQLAQFGLASSRHVDDVLARLVSTGYVVLRSIADDRRVRLLEPTERMAMHDHNTILPFFRALALLFGEARYACFLDRYRTCHRVRRTATTTIFPWAVSLLPQNSDLTLFFDRTCAIEILFQFVALSATNPEHPVRETSLAEFGNRLGMSRTHVRNVLRDAEEAGFMVRSRRDGVFHHLTPGCAAAFDRFVADALALGDQSYVLTALTRP